jgi:hypothetical protein
MILVVVTDVAACVMQQAYIGHAECRTLNTLLTWDVLYGTAELMGETLAYKQTP